MLRSMPLLELPDETRHSYTYPERAIHLATLGDLTDNLYSFDCRLQTLLYASFDLALINEVVVRHISRLSIFAEVVEQKGAMCEYHRMPVCKVEDISLTLHDWQE